MTVLDLLSNIIINRPNHKEWLDIYKSALTVYNEVYSQEVVLACSVKTDTIDLILNEIAEKSGVTFRKIFKRHNEVIIFGYKTMFPGTKYVEYKVSSFRVYTPETNIVVIQGLSMDKKVAEIPSSFIGQSN